jgi:hypothetical protein
MITFTHVPGTIVVTNVVHELDDVEFSDLIDLDVHPLPFISIGPLRYWHCLIRLTMVWVSRSGRQFLLIYIYF